MKGEIFRCSKCSYIYVLPSCCDHYQEVKIQSLRNQIVLYKECVDFYANDSSWQCSVYNDRRDLIINADMQSEVEPTYDRGGKKARETQAAIKEMEGGE